ncbi:MAG: glycosyltransferase [Flavobacteriaceae bacterium]|jgi:hypothetical protein|nr:glycosyltransferase [Flavobacteriaceae bacterium]
MIEPRLIGYSGHLYNYAISVKREIESNGGNFCILVSNECDKEIISELNGIPVFKKNPSNSLFSSLISRFIIVPILFNIHLYLGLIRFKKRTEKSWNFFMGTTQYFDLFAIFLFNCFFKKISSLVLTARMTNYNIEHKRWSISIIWYKIFLRLLYFQNKFKKNIYFITDSDNLKSEYEKISKFKINLLPIPHTLHLSEKEHTDDMKNLVVTSLGPPRVQKGFTQIEKLIKNYLIQKEHFDKKIEFHLQCNSIQDKSTYDSVKSLKELNDSRIILYEKSLSEQDYFNLLSKSNIILIPYSRLSYSVQTSGIFTEAMGFGKVTIINKDTWMSQQLKKFNIHTYCDTDNDDEFYLLFKDICKNYTKIKGLVSKASIDWNKYHNPKNFVNNLSQLIKK